MSLLIAFKKLYTIFISRPVRKTLAVINKHGHKKKCYICNHEFNSFGKYKKGNKSIPDFRKKLDIIGSDSENYSCIFCGCNDRERHLFMFFDKLNLWDNLSESRVLHFAPEKFLSEKVSDIKPPLYVMADLYPTNDSIKRIDATEIPYPDESFDFIICNHVLEHIPNYTKAIKELYRALNYGGMAIIQTPFSRMLFKNFEDDGINTDDLRLFFYGESDHRRLFSERELLSNFISAGFKVEIIPNNSLFDKNTSIYYGINISEDLIIFKK